MVAIEISREDSQPVDVPGLPAELTIVRWQQDGRWCWGWQCAWDGKHEGRPLFAASQARSGAMQHRLVRYHREAGRGR